MELPLTWERSVRTCLRERRWNLRAPSKTSPDSRRSMGQGGPSARHPRKKLERKRARPVESKVLEREAGHSPGLPQEQLTNPCRGGKLGGSLDPVDPRPLHGSSDSGQGRQPWSRVA